MSFQDRAQHQIGQIDKEVRSANFSLRSISPTNFHHDQLSNITNHFGTCEAFQISYSQQFGETDIHSQGLCLFGPRRDLLLSYIFQHWRTISRQFCRLPYPGVLFLGCSFQR